jgi:hypothetical protein
MSDVIRFGPNTPRSRWQPVAERALDNQNRRSGFGSGGAGPVFVRDDDGNVRLGPSLRETLLEDIVSDFADGLAGSGSNNRSGSDNPRYSYMSDSGRGGSYTPRPINLDRNGWNGADFEITPRNDAMARTLEAVRGSDSPADKFAAAVNALRVRAVTGDRDNQVKFLANQLQEMDPSNAVVTVNGIEVNWITELRRSNPTMADDVYARLRERAERGDISPAQFAAYSQSFGFTPQGARLAAAEDRFSPAVVAAPNLDGAPNTGAGTAAPTITDEQVRAHVIAAAEAAHAATSIGEAVTFAPTTTTPQAIDALINAPSVVDGATTYGITGATGLSNRLGAVTGRLNSAAPADRRSALAQMGLIESTPPLSDMAKRQANFTSIFTAASPADRAAFIAEAREAANELTDAAEKARYIAALDTHAAANPEQATRAQLEGARASGTGTGAGAGGRTLTGAELATVTFGDQELQREYASRVAMFNQMNGIPMVGPLINMFMNMLGMGPQSFIAENAEGISAVGTDALAAIPDEVRNRIPQPVRDAATAPSTSTTTTPPGTATDQGAPAVDANALATARATVAQKAGAIASYGTLNEETAAPTADVTRVIDQLRTMGYPIPAGATATDPAVIAAVREVEQNLGITGAGANGQIGAKVAAALGDEQTRNALKAAHDLQHPPATTPTTDRYDAAADKTALETAAQGITIASLPAETLTAVNTRLDELVGGAALADINTAGVGQANNAVKALETALISAGLMTGTADGKLDPQVIAALQSADVEVRRILTKAFEGVTAEDLTGSGVDAVIAQIGTRARTEEATMSR